MRSAETKNAEATGAGTVYSDAVRAEIAEASKEGRYLFLGEADELGADFRDRKPYEHKVDSSTRPLWDSFWILLVALVFLGAEWVLRKRARLV